MKATIQTTPWEGTKTEVLNKIDKILTVFLIIFVGNTAGLLLFTESYVLAGLQLLPMGIIFLIQKSIQKYKQKEEEESEPQPETYEEKTEEITQNNEEKNE